MSYLHEYDRDYDRIKPYVENWQRRLQYLAPSVVLHGSETWTSIYREKRRKNPNIGDEVPQKNSWLRMRIEVNVEPLDEKVQVYKLNWEEHEPFAQWLRTAHQRKMRRYKSVG